MLSNNPAFESPDLTIKLAPADWYRATWRELPPLPRPEPRPFAWEEAQEIYFDEGGLIKWNLVDDLYLIQPDMILSREEAQFWLRVLVTFARQKKDALPELSFTAVQESVSLAEAKNKLRNFHLYPVMDKVVNVILYAFDFADGIALLCEMGGYEGDVLHQKLLPYVSVQERYQLQEIVRVYLREEELLENLDLAHFKFAMPLPLWLVGGLGMVPEMEQILAFLNSFPRYTFNEPWGRRPEIWLMGLDNPDRLLEELERWRFYIWKERAVKGWLAHMAGNHLRFLQDSLQNYPYSLSQNIVNALMLVEKPEMVMLLVEVFNGESAQKIMKAQPLLRPWLAERPEIALMGLAPLVNRNDHIGAAARDYVQWLVTQKEPLRNYFEQLVGVESWRPQQINAPAYPENEWPAWWLAAVGQPQDNQARLPEWLKIDELPLIVCHDGFALHEKQVIQLLSVMVRSELKRPHPLILAVQDRAIAESLTMFVEKLITVWGRYVSVEKTDRWLLSPLVWWHAEGLATRVFPIIMGKLWRPRIYADGDVLWFPHLLAVWEQIASDEILRLLGRLQRQKRLLVSYETIQASIDRCMVKRGLDRSQLHDLMIPKFGLNEQGERHFIYGQDEIVLKIDEDIRPVLRWKNREHHELPDELRETRKLSVQQIVSAWDRIERELPKILENELWRLDRALVYERRWKWAEFEAMFLRHPVMRHLGRSIIWGRYRFNGELTHSFVLTEDGVPLSADYDEVHLPNYGYYGLIHPIDLQPDERLTWHEMLTDYEIVTIFDQLFRPVYTLTAEERNSSILTRFDNGFDPEMIFTLRSLHWKPLEGLSTWRRFFPYSNVSALLSLRTVSHADGSQVTLFEGCRFAQGKVELEGFQQVEHVAKLPLNWLLPRRVRPRIVSEVLWDWARAVAHGGGA